MGLLHSWVKGQVRLELAEERAGQHSQKTREGQARQGRKGTKTPLLVGVNHSAAHETAALINK